MSTAPEDQVSLPMTADSRRRLEAFVARVATLETFTFFEKGIAGIRLSQVGDHWLPEYYGPSLEQLRAMLVDVRVFIQSDDISIGQMAKLYSDPGVSADWKRDHQIRRAHLNERLKRVVTESPSKGVLTHQIVLDMFLYGRHVHYKEKDEGYRLYDTWVTEANHDLLEDTFIAVVIWIITIAQNIARVSRKELERSAAGKSPSRLEIE